MSSIPSQPAVPTPYTPPGETFIEKAKRKTVEEPLVPIGALATVLAVSMATRQFRRGDRTSMNQWLRVRVAAQGFTVLAICTYGFALRWRKLGQESGTDAGIPTKINEDVRGSIAGNIHATPAALLREAAKEKEKADFERRLDEAVTKDRLEHKENERGEKEKVDWKSAWKEGILRKNKENDEKRGKRSDRNE